jgi:hypothetical protein
MLDHDDGVGAAWDRAAGGDSRRRPRSDQKPWGNAAGDDFTVEPERYGRGFTRGGDVRRPHGEPVDRRAVERRHVHGGGNGFGQNPA